MDWSKGTVLVRGTKTDKARSTVPMTALTSRELLAWWKVSGQPVEGLAFLYRGEQIREWKHALASTAKRAGISKDVTPYVARHTFATLAVCSGSNQAAVRSMMRHTHRSTILERAYERLSQDQVAAGMANFPSFGGGTR